MTTRLAQLARQLDALLVGQQRELQSVVATLRREREGLISDHSAPLEEAHERLERAAEHAVTLETQRRDLCNELATELGIPSEQLRVSRLAPRVGGQLARSLLAHAEDLQRSASDLQVELRIGAELLEWSSHCNQSLVECIEASVESPATYERSGGAGRESTRPRLVDATL